MSLHSNSFLQSIPCIKGIDHLGRYHSTGGEFLWDFMSGTSCVGIGHGSAVQRRIVEHFDQVPFNSYDYKTVWRAGAEKALLTLHPDYEFAFFSGGAEAVEASIRIANDLRGRSFCKVAGFTGGFSGKSYLSGLLTDGIESEITTILTYDKISSITEDVSVVMLEPFQCRNGVNIPSVEFLKNLVTECESKGIVLIDDEISTSLRSGYANTLDYLIGYKAPVICLGKNYGQGVPVSLVGVRRDLVEKVKVSLTSGFGGNPLACIAVIESVREILLCDLLKVVKENGRLFYKILHESLAGVKCYGFGMWFAVELKDEEIAEMVARKLLQLGFLVGLVGNRIKLAPPFCISIDIWKDFSTKFREVLR